MASLRGLTVCICLRALQRRAGRPRCPVWRGAGSRWSGRVHRRRSTSTSTALLPSHSSRPPARRQSWCADAGAAACPAPAHRPASSGRWSCDQRPRRGRHAFEVTVADRELQIPAHRPQNDHDTTAARHFIRKALAQAQTVDPRTLTVDKNAAYSNAAKTMKKTGELRRFTKLRQSKHLNYIEQRFRGDRAPERGVGAGSLIRFSGWSGRMVRRPRRAG